MTLVKGTQPASNASNGIRLWGKFISDALATVGWVKTSDTGQIDLTTVGTPGAANTSMGYEIWRMNDSLQSTNPVFMKLEYGSGSTTSAVGIWVTLGSGSDGAGNLTGQLTNRMQFTAYNNSSITLYGCFVSGNSSRAVISMFTGTDVAGAYGGKLILIIERSHTSAGVDNTDGVLVIANHYGGALTQWLPSAGAVPNSQAAFNCSAPPAGTGASGARIDTYPVRVWMPGESCPSIQAFAYFNADLTTLVPISINTWDGSSHTYLPCAAYNGWSYGGTTVGLLRFD